MSVNRAMGMGLGGTVELRPWHDGRGMTSQALEDALHAMRPLSQRCAMALGVSAPEPQCYGLSQQVDRSR